MSRLVEAVDAILAGQPDRDEWTALCVATVRLGHALAGWDDARRRLAIRRRSAIAVRS